MRYILIAVLFCLALISCSKTTCEFPPYVDPQMAYIDLNGAIVSYQQRSKVLDIDGDGKTDFGFGVQLLGDPVLQRDRLQFLVYSAPKCNLLNDANDQSPVLGKMDRISIKHPGYDWWEISAIVLAEKIITNTSTSWDGAWRNAEHNYLPIQIEKEGKFYHGWIELSFSMAEEELILHRAGISKEEGKTVFAGQ